MKTVFLLGLLVALITLNAGCNQSRDTEPLIEMLDKIKIDAECYKGGAMPGTFVSMTPKERWQCLVDGGEFFCGAVGETCFRPTVDAGKKCKTSKNCEAYCLADTLTCSPVTPPGGCLDIIGRDGQKDSICIDY
jgi:hypothetical protein